MGRLEAKGENNALIKSMLERTIFSAWRAGKGCGRGLVNFRGLELDLDYTCNLGCKYCYVNRYHEKLYPDASETEQLENLSAVIRWLRRNRFRPKVEVFGGEPLARRLGINAINMITEGLGGYLEDSVTIPTNFTFLISQEQTKLVEQALDDGNRKGLRYFLSASFDGKYCEANRPFKYNTICEETVPGIWKFGSHGFAERRDDSYYDMCFKFAKKYGCGFHPMIYSEKIEFWRENFLWFQEMFAKHSLPWWGIYLLEVRNPEWTPRQIREFGYFVEFLVDWSWRKLGRSKSRMLKFLLEGKGFNLLGGMLTTIGRGLGCSIQSGIQLRLGDLAIAPCHRTSYRHLILGRLKVDGGEIVGVEAINPELWITVLSMDGRNMPFCESCMIKDVCHKGCLGAQYEVSGDLFTPIPTVCMLEHEKIWAFIRALKRIGIYPDILSLVNERKRQTFLLMESISKR